MKTHPAPVVLASLVLTACSSDLTTTPDGPSGPTGSLPEAASVRISPSIVTHPFSLDTFTLKAVALYPDGYEIKGKRLAWSSLDTAIVTVDSTGRVYTESQGAAHVVAAVDGVSDTAQITIDPGLPLLNDCLTCHWDDNRDRHLAWGFDVATCDACHAVNDEPHATLRSGHPDASGGFELLGAHGGLACAGCHVVGDTVLRFAPADELDCLACHEADYEVQHSSSNYPTVCLTCHTTDGWTGASFDHTTASAGFALAGAHVDLTCTACHDAVTFAPLYTPTSDSDCVACHQDDYDTQHSGSDYPSDCLTCHTTDGWTGTTFDHDADYFPIYTSEHTSRWTACSDCHTNADDFSQFTCFSCHAHNQTSMNQQHSGVTGYAYQSTSCYGCHPNGAAP